jgi:predicted enzyme related to lactoylglutathione lyase
MAAGLPCKSHKCGVSPRTGRRANRFSSEISQKTSPAAGSVVGSKLICHQLVEERFRCADKTPEVDKHEKRLSESIRVSSWNMQLRSAILYVKDLERMRRFYAEMLGTGSSNQGWTDAWATFETGGACFSLHAIPAEIAKRIAIESPPIPREEQSVKLIFEVTDVELERARLESLGIQILRRSWQRPGEACDAVDPEGNVFQIRSRLP